MGFTIVGIKMSCEGDNRSLEGRGKFLILYMYSDVGKLHGTSNPQ